MIRRFALRNNAYKISVRLYSEGASQNRGTGGHTLSQMLPPSAQVNADVTGLSSACILPATQAVGPGVDPNKSGAYKVPEYFCYDSTSFFEAEVEMAKFRCPQPSALKK